MEQFIAGWNVPGYLPETVEAFESFDEAKRYIISELKIREGHIAELSEDGATTFCHTAEDVNLESGLFTTTTQPDGYVYFVARGEADEPEPQDPDGEKEPYDDTPDFDLSELE